jgi:hypothetical protein
LALPLVDSRDRAAVELQVASSTAAREVAAPPEPPAPAPTEPPRVLVAPVVGLLLPQAAINAAPTTKPAICNQARFAMDPPRR